MSPRPPNGVPSRYLEPRTTHKTRKTRLPISGDDSDIGSGWRQLGNAEGDT